MEVHRERARKGKRTNSDIRIIYIYIYKLIIADWVCSFLFSLTFFSPGFTWVPIVVRGGSRLNKAARAPASLRGFAKWLHRAAAGWRAPQEQATCSLSLAYRTRLHEITMMLIIDKHTSQLYARNFLRTQQAEERCKVHAYAQSWHCFMARLQAEERRFLIGSVRSVTRASISYSFCPVLYYNIDFSQIFDRFASIS